MHTGQIAAQVWTFSVYRTGGTDHISTRVT